MTKQRKLEIVKFILNNYPNSCLYANYVAATNLPKEKWDSLVDLNSEEEYLDDVQVSDLEHFFLHELMKVCGCGVPTRIEVLTLYWLNLIASKQQFKISEILTKEKHGFALTFSEIADVDYRWAFLYWLGSLEFIKHGFSITNPTITELGKMCLDVFHDELDTDNYKSLFPKEGVDNVGPEQEDLAGTPS